MKKSLYRHHESPYPYSMTMNAVELSLFVSRMEAVCEEMGVVLRRTAFSPNIKDRLDFSCALFDAAGELSAQAAHIPVHLGSMAYAMAEVVNGFEWQEGDVVILNDPFLGGTHLPDVTVVAPFFFKDRLLAFAVNRAHHANIGSETPGSMPLSTTLEEEGILISPRYLYKAGQIDPATFELLRSLQMSDSGSKSAAPQLGGDIAAQLSAARIGVLRLQALLDSLGEERFSRGLLYLNDYGERMAEFAIEAIPDGCYRFSDVMDDDGVGTCNIEIAVAITVAEGKVAVDFAGTSAQVAGNLNCPLSVTAAAVFYAFRCLMPASTPACAGIFRPISLQAETGLLVNARAPAAVAAGNVETSSRIVDVILGALQQALPDRIPAASQGTMNNIAMGEHDRESRWDYYETLAGGMGGGPCHQGLSAVHTHMTNTLNTPVETLEMHYPVRIRRYGLRRGSGGSGRHSGGDGLVREYEFLRPASVSILSERRISRPWGIQGGEPGREGCNVLNQEDVGAKRTFRVEVGDRLTIETPGGGGWGSPGDCEST